MAVMIADARPVEEVRAAQPSSPTANARLREPPMLSICELLGYDVGDPANADADHTMYGTNNVSNACW